MVQRFDKKKLMMIIRDNISDSICDSKFKSQFQIHNQRANAIDINGKVGLSVKRYG